MQAQQFRDRMNTIEQCADQAVAACRQAGGQVPDDLRQCVDQLHQQARQLRNQSGDSDGGQMVGAVDQLEQTGDRAMQACRQAGQADPQLKSAVQRAHDEISSLKKQLH